MKNNNDVWLSFKTDRATHELLKFLSKKLDKTLPEFINEICKEYIESLLEAAQNINQKDPT